MKKIIFALLLLASTPLFADEYDNLVQDAVKILYTDPARAAGIIEIAISKYPDRGDAYIVRGILIYQSGKDFRLAGEQFRKGILLTPEMDVRMKFMEAINSITTGTKSREEQFNLKSGYDLISSGDPGQALTFLLEGLRLNPGNVSIIYEIAYACVELQDFTKAIEYLEMARMINPVSYRILAETAYCYSQTGNVGKSKEVLDELVLIFGERPEFYHEFAFAVINAGDREGAMKLLEENITRFPEFYVSYYTLGQMYFQDGRCDTARKFLSVMLSKAKKEHFENTPYYDQYDQLMSEAKRMHDSCKQGD